MKNEDLKVIEAFKDKGFTVIDTGGNCTAFYKEIDNLVQIITDEGGCRVPETFREAIAIGIYDKAEYESGDVDEALSFKFTTIEDFMEAQ